MAVSRDESERVKFFVAGNKFKQLQGQKVVVVVGKVGAGKSTMIAVQTGATYSRDLGKLRLVHSRTPTPQTSDGWNANTLQVSPFRDPDSDIIFVDTPGLNENRGAIYEIWTSFSTAMLLKLVGSIQAIVVVVNFNEAFESRGEGLRKLALDLKSLLGTGEGSKRWYESMVFFFTNAFYYGWQLTNDEVASRVRQFRDSEREIYEEELDRLNKTFPMKFVSAVSSAMTSRDINWDDVPQARRDELEARRTSLVLAHAILQSHEQGRCMVSAVHDKQSSEEQRKTILRMVRSTTPISRLELDEILKMKVTNSQAVSNLLAAVLTQKQENWSLLSLVKRRERCLRQLETVCDRDGKTVRGISGGDWKAYRQSLTSERRREQNALQLHLEKAQQEVRHLETSSQLMVFQTIEVREVRSSGAFSWVVLGGGYARRTIAHRGEPFEDFHLEGRHFALEDSVVSEGEGSLTMKLASAHGYDLHVDGQTLRKEKDLPGSKERVRFLKQEIGECTEKLVELDQEIRLLAAIKEPKQLIDHVVQEKAYLEAELMEARRQLRRNVPDTDGLCESKVLEAMIVLVPLLLRTGGVPEDLAPAERQSMEDFVKACEEVEACRQRLEGDDVLKGVTSAALSSLKLQGPDLQWEQVEPVLNWPEKAQAMAADWVRGSSENLHYVKTCLQHEPLPYGIAMLAVSHQMPSSTVGWWARLALHFLGLFLIVKVLLSSSHSCADSLQRGAMPLGVQLQRLLQQVPQRLVEMAMQMVQSIANRLDVQVRMDSRDLCDQPEGLLSRALGLAVYFLKR